MVVLIGMLTFGNINQGTDSVILRNESCIVEWVDTRIDHCMEAVLVEVNEKISRWGRAG